MQSGQNGYSQPLYIVTVGTIVVAVEPVVVLVKVKTQLQMVTAAIDPIPFIKLINF